MTDPATWTITTASRNLRQRRCSCREYIEVLIGQCERLITLNAFTSHDWDNLMDMARAIDDGTRDAGVLGGIPLVFKDNINTRMLATTAGTGALQRFVASEDAPVARALFGAGALLGAKGNMHELAFGITNNNAVTGASRNPWNPMLIPGGSSGGVAVAIAARMMPGGIGTDTAGSVRLPAALCGIVGFRPSVGRYASDGIVPISHTRDTAGPMARSVADIVLLDAMMTGSTGQSRIRDPRGLRLGVAQGRFFDNLEESVAKEAARVLDLLADAGVELVDIDTIDITELDAATGFPVTLFEFPGDLRRYLAENALPYSLQDILDGIGSPGVREIVAEQLSDTAMAEDVYLRARNVDRPRLQLAWASRFETANVEAVIFPTSPLTARPVGEDETVELNGERVPTFETYIRNTSPGSIAGIPGISLPTGLAGTGLPIGMELEGPGGADVRLLEIAATVEDIIGFDASPLNGSLAGNRRRASGKAN